MMAKRVICQYVRPLRLTGGHVILSSPSSALVKEQAVWGGAVSFYRILSEGSSYRTILLFSFMDSLNGKITSCIRLILPMALQMVSLRQVGLPKYNYKSSQIIKTEENASLQLLT